jgi:hypothetical protein
MALQLYINEARQNIENVKDIINQLRERKPELAKKIMPYFFLITSNQMRIENFLQKYQKMIPYIDLMGLDTLMDLMAKKTKILYNCAKCTLDGIDNNLTDKEIDKKCLKEINNVDFFNNIVRMIDENKELIAIIIGSILFLKYFKGGVKHGSNYDN